MKSLIHDDNGFNEGYAMDDQLSGTFFNKNESIIFSKVKDITISPLIALFKSLNDFIITANNLLY